MHWNRFFGSGGPMGATYGQNDQFGAKTGLVAPNWWNSVGQWGKQARAKPRWCNGTISQVSNGHWGVCGPQNSLLWSPWALWSILWLTITLSYTKIIPIYCLSYAFTISNLDWRWSTRLEPPNPRMVPRAIFSSFGPYWGPMAPPMAHLTNKTVPMHHHGWAMTSSTLIPHCSTRLEPPDPLMAKKGRFWPHWTLCVPFDAPGWPPMTHKTVARHHPRCSLTCSTLILNCFIRL